MSSPTPATEVRPIKSNYTLIVRPGGVGVWFGPRGGRPAASGSKRRYEEDA